MHRKPRGTRPCHADERSRAKFLPKLIGGEHVYAVAFAEAGSRFDLFHVETTAKPVKQWLKEITTLARLAREKGSTETPADE